MPTRRHLITAAIPLVAAAAIGADALFSTREVKSTRTGSGTALVGGPFSLVNQDGQRVTEQDFRGHYMLVFFGFTFCPDVCPTELQVMMAALGRLGARGEAVQPVFITVDPERDSPEVMKAYVGNFGARLVGLTGSAAEIAAVAKAYRVYYAKTGDVDSADYLVDHTSIIYLMAPDGSFRTHFTYTTDAEKLADGIVAALDRSP